jgi:hypothetical protein
VVLADRMACLKGAVVANVVVPAPAYVRFAIHYGFRPDFCEAADPESNAVEHSEICVVPDLRLVEERELFGSLPSLRPAIGKTVLRKVDRLSCVRFGSARYSGTRLAAASRRPTGDDLRSDLDCSGIVQASRAKLGMARL